MKILFVINNAYTKGNGLAASCRRTIQYLREAGEDVRLLSAPGSEEESPDYPLPEGRIPFFHTLIKQQGYDAMIRKAVRWADVKTVLLMRTKITLFLLMKSAVICINLLFGEISNGGLLISDYLMPVFTISGTHTPLSALKTAMMSRQFRKTLVTLQPLSRLMFTVTLPKR